MVPYRRGMCFLNYLLLTHSSWVVCVKEREDNFKYRWKSSDEIEWMNISVQTIFAPKRCRGCRRGHSVWIVSAETLLPRFKITATSRRISFSCPNQVIKCTLELLQISLLLRSLNSSHLNYAWDSKFISCPTSILRFQMCLSAILDENFSNVCWNV